MEKAVFQRNQNNFASLSIAGNYPANTSISYIQARLINPANENVVISWTTIQNNPTGGIFRGALPGVYGGWYRLEIQAISGIDVVGTATLNRVGIGEVFLIAGQSNAQGLEGFEAIATDERVVTHNELTWYDNNAGKCDNKFPGYPVFSQMSGGAISKTGNSIWCYGKLGDLLTSKLGVPVAFFNAAATSTSSINWKESSEGLATVNHYNGEQFTFCNQLGVPYSGLKRIMNYYASIFGVRAILWHQGETDNFLNTTENDYQNNITYVINKSRNDFGSTIPWVISKATLTGFNDTQSDIKVAQQTLGSDNGNKLFSGPDTDGIPDRQQDGVHLDHSGIVQLANLWDASLDANFFSNATPILAKALPGLSVNQINSEFQLTAPDGYAAYKWVRLDIGNTDYEDNVESENRILNRTNGTYRCYLTDYQGNITFTQPVICGCSGSLNCGAVTYLSNMVACTAFSDISPVKYDQSHNGNPIKLNGVTYAKGIGCHANSEITYKLNGNFGRFISDIGIDDEVLDSADPQASVYFRVYADNVFRYESPVLSNLSPIAKININVQGVQELKLIVNQGPNENFNDHADWAGARLHCVDNQNPSTPQNLYESNVGQKCATINWAASTDNMEVAKYLIYLNNALIDSVDAPATSYRIQGLAPSYYYTVRIQAKDFSGNVSELSTVIDFPTKPDLLAGASPQTINIGQSAKLETSYEYSCFGGTIIWSTGETTNTINVSPAATAQYTAACKIGDCTSNPVNITVKVIPDCATSYNLISPADDFSGLNIDLSLRASSTIIAGNEVLPDARILYQAGNSITLQPGFKVQSGTVFKAQIDGCNN